MNICACATATGGALAIIRVSGPQAIGIASRVFKPRSQRPLDEANGQSLHYGDILDGDIVIDEAMASVYRAPHSFTGEDSVEFSCHGSRYIVGEVLRLLCAKGCRPANPGEFTKRAFLNGKIDLSQAEAVADVIVSQSLGQHRVAMSQLRGGISTRLSMLRDKLIHLTSLLELELDFSDHEDLEFANRDELLAVAREAEEHIARLAASFKQGQAIRHGIPVAIVGKTNVGKSTLLNALLADDRAIVSDTHGTTRDTIEETFVIHDLQFRLIDTAGLRATNDAVEKIGIERTLDCISRAAIIVWVCDTAPTAVEEEEMLALCHGKQVLHVGNKCDLHPALPGFFSISAREGEGIERLTEEIYSMGQQLTVSQSDVIITNARHYSALLSAHDDIQQAITQLEQGVSGDIVAEDLRSCISHCNTILGASITPQDTLNSIFSAFCVGK